MSNTFGHSVDAISGQAEPEALVPNMEVDVSKNVNHITTPAPTSPASGEDAVKEPDATPVANSATFEGKDDGIEVKVQDNENSVGDMQVDKLSDITDCEEALSLVEVFMGQASELIGPIVDGDDLVTNKEPILREILATLENAVNAVKKGIDLLSKERLAEDVDAMEAAARERGYKGLDAFLEEYGYTKNKKAGDVKDAGENLPSASQDKPINKKADDPYDRLLKDEFTGAKQPDLKKGYYKRYGIKPVTGWVKEFIETYGRLPTPDDCRDATVEEKDGMRIANQDAFNSIKRRNRRSKKQ